MKLSTVFNEDFQDYKSQVLQFLNDFHLSGETIYDGSRNILKQKKVKDKAFVIKYFKKPHLVNQIAYKFFRPSKATRSYTYAQRLLQSGIGTPLPVAYRNTYSWFGIQKSYYVSEFQKHDYTFRELSSMEDKSKRNKILFEFVEFTHQLHENKIHFLDHSPGNTLIEERDDKFYFYLVDLNRMKFETLTLEQRIQNFARLTRDEELIQEMSKAYAKITNQNNQKIYDMMTSTIHIFFEKRSNKKAFKNKLRFWKKA